MTAVLSAGDIVGTYRVVRMLGQGGMGAVYEVEHPQIGRRAVIKLLHLDIRKHPSLFQRFVNEARAANQIDHPGVVQVFEFGQLPDGTPWMLMEYLPGDALDKRLRQFKNAVGLAVPEVLTILHQLATILRVAHAAGIVHRDLKPGNVVLVPDPAVPSGERVHLLDFGIAKLLNDSVLEEEGAAAVKTAVGSMLGTPAYMAPEQCRASDSVDGQADVYALGVIGYQLLSGRLPFRDAQPMALMAAKLTESAPLIVELVPSLNPNLASLVMSMLAKEPGDRPTMPQIEVALTTLLGLAPPKWTTSHPRVTPLGNRSDLNSGLLAGVLSTGSEDTNSVPNSAIPVTEQPTPPPIAVSGVEPVAGSSNPPGGGARRVTEPLVPAIPKEPSIGQQPTRSEVATRRSWSPLIALLLIGSLATTAGILWMPAGVRDHAQKNGATDLSHGLVAPSLPESVQLDLGAVPLDLSTAPPPPDSNVGVRKPEGCQVPSSRCFIGAELSSARQDIVMRALDGVHFKLCKGERLVFQVASKVRIKSAPESLSRDSRDTILFEINGSDPNFVPKGEFTIRCERAK